MKNKSTLLLLALSLASCAGNNVSSSVSSSISDVNISEMIEKMRKANYHVKFTGTQTITFPEEYDLNNDSRELLVERDYGFVNGKIRAARTYESGSTTTVFEDDDGRIYSELINASNEVERSYPNYLGNYYQFDAYYGSPFDYFTKRDFNENTLGSEKALFLFKTYTGINQPVESATLHFNEEGYVSNVDFVFKSLPIGFETLEGVETYFQDLTGSMSFEYEGVGFETLRPYEEKSTAYESALSHIKDNYTLTLQANSLACPVVAYIHPDFVYIHGDANAKSPVENDMYYVKKGSSYRSYNYSGSEWVRSVSIDSLAGIVPDFASLSPYIVEELEYGHLASKKEAGNYCGEHFLLPYLGIISGTCYRSDFYLNDGELDYVTSSFAYYESNIITKSIFTDVNSTSLPLWFEAPSN